MRINLKALEETSMLDNIKEFWIICRFLPSFNFFSGFWVFPFLCYSFKYHFDAGFSVFFLLISRIYHIFVGIYLPDAILLCLFLYRTGNCCFLSRPIYSILEYFYFDVFKFYNFPVSRNYFYCLSNFSLLFQECSIVNTLVGHLVSLTT